MLKGPWVVFSPSGETQTTVYSTVKTCGFAAAPVAGARPRARQRANPSEYRKGMRDMPTSLEEVRDAKLRAHRGPQGTGAGAPDGGFFGFRTESRTQEKPWRNPNPRWQGGIYRIANRYLGTRRKG